MLRFTFQPEPAATILRLEGPEGPVPVEHWALQAPAPLRRGVDLVQKLLAADSAVAEDTTVLIEHRSIAALSAEQAAALQLPPAVDAIAVLESVGLVSRPDFALRLSWETLTGQALPGVARIGAWLEVGGAWRRILEPLFSIAEAVDRFAKTDPADEAGRLAALAELRELLPGAMEEGSLRVPGFLGRLRIAVADAFSIDVQGQGPTAKLIPILFRAGDPNRPLLDEDRQARFAKMFHDYGTARDVYVLGPGNWVVSTPTLRRALQVVREVQSAPWRTKQALLRDPRAFLRERLGEELDETVLEQLFVETPAYSARVIGLGLWQPRTLPWVETEPTDWFGPETGQAANKPVASVARGGLLVGDRKIPLDAEKAKAIRSLVEHAIGRGQPSVTWQGPEGASLEIPAKQDTLIALQRLIDTLEGGLPETEESPRRAGPGPVALLILPNEATLDYEAEFRKRAAGEVGAIPASLRTPLMEHQREGLFWLQRAWQTGRPGVLLADEMGLGKTLQVLAFLAWLRESMEGGIVDQAPILVVAPTGLLANWKAEHDRHLCPPGLGRLLRAFGKDLKAIKRIREDGSPGLDTAALSHAAWILTTYEILRDFDRDFGAIDFAAIAFDEAQKIKNPAVRLTDAAKAMKATFTIMITGTPVENRLADLWCIADTGHPGLLGELRTFSQTYEREPKPEILRKLHRFLTHEGRYTPPFLLRRLRADHLRDLPSFTIERRKRPMPPLQRDAYEAVVAAARAGTGRGGVLEALQRLRAVSLHPAPTIDDEKAFLAASARLQITIEILDGIRARREAALLFLDDLDLMARLTTIFQRRYAMEAPPPVISGEVAGGRRQALVDAFQEGYGFGLLLLSPRAGGVGLTLTRANHVIHLARWWNPAVEDQCNGRALRIGQQREVTIYLPFAVLPDGAGSFDENLDQLLERKRKLFYETLAPPQPSEQELEELLRRTTEAA